MQVHNNHNTSAQYVYYKCFERKKQKQNRINSHNLKLKPE